MFIMVAILFILASQLRLPGLTMALRQIHGGELGHGSQLTRK